MSDIDKRIDKHYGFGGIMEKIEAGLRAAGKDLDALAVDTWHPSTSSIRGGESQRSRWPGWRT